VAERSTIGVGIVGFGFMGRTHLAAYQAAAREGWPCEVLAVCDGDPESVAQVRQCGEAGMGHSLDSTRTRMCENFDEMLSNDRVKVVSICTYTDSHVDLAIRALDAGKHVLVEKPVALRSRDVQRLCEATARSDRRCMPAMCMRFWPGWDWLIGCITAGSLGPVRNAAFTRLGSGPIWASDFYRDVSRSGGAMFDLHIHDADFILACLKTPRAVSSTGSVNHVKTLYKFSDGPSPVSAEGGWSLPPGAEFRMRYVVEFEEATADFDLTRNPPLLLHRPNHAETIAIQPGTGYDGEIRHLLDCVHDPSQFLRVTLRDALQVTLLLEAELESLRTGQPVSVRHAPTI